MKLAAVTMILALSAGLAVAQEPVAFGYIREVVFEPNSEAPERVQLWGTFSVAGREEGAYQIPEDGYLYFALPGKDADKARAEWRELAKWPKERVAAISLRGRSIRVWTETEQVTRPETYYTAGYALDRTGAGVKLLSEVPKESVRHYAVVDSVEASTKDVRIWGTFSIEGEPARRGYVFFTQEAGEESAGALKDWRAVAGTGRPVAFYTKSGAGSLRVRDADEALWEPDRVPVLRSVVVVQNSGYWPIRRLIGSKCGGPCY